MKKSILAGIACIGIAFSVSGCVAAYNDSGVIVSTPDPVIVYDWGYYDHPYYGYGYHPLWLRGERYDRTVYRGGSVYAGGRVVPNGYYHNGGVSHNTVTHTGTTTRGGGSVTHTGTTTHTGSVSRPATRTVSTTRHR